MHCPATNLSNIVKFSFGFDRSPRNANICSFVRLTGSSLSKALNLHHSGSDLQTALSHPSQPSQLSFSLIALRILLPTVEA